MTGHRLYNLAPQLVAASMTPRAVCTIDLDALTHNFGEVQRLVGREVKVCGVIKANAYGHGAVPVGRALERAGARALAVTSLDEASELRAADLRLPILVLSGVEPSQAPDAIRLGLTPVVWDAAQLHALAEAVPDGSRLPIHLKFDTGMRRLGADDAAAISEAARHPQVVVEGVLSHLACADEPGHTSIDDQIRGFEAAISAVEAAGLNPGVRHLANSAGLLAHPGTYFDMVRTGLLLYGCFPHRGPEPQARRLDLKPVMELKTTILHVKTAPAGAGVGYGWTFETARDSKLAVLRIGYGQGYPRALSNRAYVSVRGGRAPVVGAVSMDHITIDVTGIEGVETGDEATLWGGPDGPSVGELATAADTISYELLTRIPRDAERIYRGKNE